MSRVIDSFRRVQVGDRTSYDEPTYLGFKIIFHFNTSPLLNISESSNTAYKFLIDNGYNDKAFMLKNMVEELKYVSQNNQFYFQSIEGLDAIWAYNFRLKRAKSKDELIIINTLEALDLRITKILDYCFNACYSYKKRTEIVPHNLRYFDMSIYIKDWRFHKSQKVDFDSESNSASLFFKLTKCEFKPFTHGVVLNTLTNTEKDMKSNKIEIISWGEVESYSSYVLKSEIGDRITELDSLKPQPFLYADERLKPIEISSNSLGDMVRQRTTDVFNTKANEYQERLTQMATRTGDQLVSDIIGEVSGNFKQSVLGNVYGNKDIRTVNNLLNSQLKII